ncbi:MAG: hypothetical protein ACHQM6_02360 [Candidatus Kapaibacterium sp.]
MKYTYLNNIPLAQGEITVVMSKNAAVMAKHSWELAANIQNVGMGVLLINCGMSKRKFNQCEETTVPEPNTGKLNAGEEHLVVHSSVRGDLAGERDAIVQKVRDCNIGVVILSGWEWTSSSYRRKQRLLYNLRELMEDEDVAIVIYSQARTEPVAGEYDRGGLGQLAMLAEVIIKLEASEDLKKQISRPTPLVALPAEMEAAERSAQLMINKINELQGEKGELKIKNEKLKIEERGEMGVVERILFR